MSKLINNQFRMACFLISCLFLQQTLAWDQRIFDITDGDQAGRIIKQKWFGIDDLTYYRVRVKVQRPELKMRIAVQWMHNNQQYSSVMFTGLEVGNKEFLEPIVDVRRGQDVALQDFFTPSQYLIILSGITSQSSRYLTRDGANKYKAISYLPIDDNTYELLFSVQGHEPYGQAKIWLTYIDYSYDECAQSSQYCLSTGRVQLQMKSNIYYNVQETRDYLDIGLFDSLYYGIMFTSWFWYFGWPIQLIFVLVLNFYLDFNAVMSILRTLEYFKQQGRGTDVDGFMKWYLLATIVNWIGGSAVLSGSMLGFTPYPIFGGLINWFIYEGVRTNLYKEE